MEVNLTRIFILPLLKINYKTLQGFESARIDRYTNAVYVKTEYENEFLERFKEFDRVLQIDGYYIYCFTMSTQFIPDLELFKQSQYSKMSKTAKVLIGQYSGLEKNNIILHKLNKTETARQYVMKQVDKYSLTSQGHDVLDINDEYLPTIDEREFI